MKITPKLINLKTLVLTLICFSLFFSHIEKIASTQNNDLSHNYIVFLDKNKNLVKKTPEINGWLLLENLLRKSLKRKDQQLHLKFFQNKPDKNLFGWWPQKEMRQGKNYFQGMPPIKLPYDLDVTAWAYKIFQRPIPQKDLGPFLSSEDMIPPFKKTCRQTRCHKNSIFRVWGNPHWHEEMDIVVIANALTSLNQKEESSRSLFLKNARLVNKIINSKSIFKYSLYYKPEVTVYFLLLFFDREGTPYLTEKSKKKLLQQLKKNFSQFKEKAIISQWGGRKNPQKVHGHFLFYGNEKILKLMKDYTEKYWPESVPK